MTMSQWLDVVRAPRVCEMNVWPNLTQCAGGKEQPWAKALFDFDAENDGEISFKEGDKIKLIERLDENWLQGEVGAI
jgi:hypothetical protein